MKPRACRSCGAAGIWTTTERGKRLLLEPARPDQTRELFVVRMVGGKPQAVAASPDGLPGPKFVAHFANCPDADEWRNRGR